MTATRSDEPLLYTGWTRPRASGLFGATWIATILCGLLIIAVMVTFMFTGPKTGFTAAGMSFAIAAPLVWQRDGRSGYEMAVLRMQWLRGKRRKEHFYRGGLFSEVPGGQAQLPGLLAPTRLYEGEDSAGFAFGMIHLPATHQYTVVLRAWPQGDEAVDQSLINQWCGEWGIVLASAGLTSDMDGLVPVIDTVPETGNRLLGEAHSIVADNAPALAREVVFQAAMHLPQEEVQMVPRIAVTFAATTDARKKDPAEQAVEIGRRLPGICHAIEASGVAVRPMRAGEIVGFVRRSFDPAAQLAIERADAVGDDHGITWEDAGPISHEEKWDEYWHDGGRSITWEMEAGPKSAVDEGVLRRLLAPNAELPRKRVAIVYRPHTAADSTKIVDDDYRDALVDEQSGRATGSVAATIRVEATGRARQQLARGHGLTRVGLLITITEPLDGDIPRVDALVRDLATQCQLKIRRCYRYQAAAFAASLGVGVLLPEHATLPDALAG